MAKSQQNEKSGKDKFLESFSRLLYKNRVLFITVLCLIIAALAVLGVVLALGQKNAEKAAVLSEGLQESFTSWAEETDEAAKAALKDAIIQTADEIQSSYPKTFGSQRSIMIVGQMFYMEESWSESAEHYRRVADDYPDSYLAAPSLEAAAAAYEEAGMIDEAVESLRRITENYADDTLASPHAFFSLGRLEEQRGNLNEALTSYEDLAGKFPESSWTKLAQDRIIVLKAEE